MNFYDTVTEQNAISWYAELPAHLRKTIDVKIATLKPGASCTPKDCPTIHEQVVRELGNRSLKPADPIDELEGWNKRQTAQWEAFKKWVARYDELLLIQTCVELAPSLQKERKMLSQALGIGDVTSFPPQSDGLDDMQAATVRWIQQTGETPLEFLANTYRDGSLKASDRISAARAMLDFVHRKVPVKSEVETNDISKPKLAPTMLKVLSAKELNQLESLLKKLGDE